MDELLLEKTLVFGAFVRELRNKYCAVTRVANGF
jgi:hypothetical protein